MAKVRDLTQALDQYKGSENNSFFQLKDDKDTAIVRFLHGNELVPEEDWFVVHKAKISGKDRWVQCTEESDCPLCASHGKPKLKLFLQLLDSRDDKRKTWERGERFIPQIMELINKYGSLCGRQFEIVRNGKAGDNNTTYKLYPLEADDTSLEDIEEKQELLGTDKFILQLSTADMRKVAQGTYVIANANVDQKSATETQRRERREIEGSDIF